MTPSAASAARALEPTHAARAFCAVAPLAALLVQEDLLGTTYAPMAPALWGGAALLGLIAWWWGARFAAGPRPPGPQPSARQTPVRRGVFAFTLAAALLGIGSGLVLLHADLLSDRGAWLWALGLGAYPLAWAAREGTCRVTATRNGGWTIQSAVVLAVVLAAFGLRLYRLSEVPPTFLQDEAAVAEWGLNWLHGTPLRTQATAAAVTLFRNGTTAYPLPGSVLQALVMQAAGETVFGARLTAAVAGGLTVWVLLSLLRDVTSPWAALAGALLLSVNHVDLYWTRSGMLQSLTTLLATVVLWQTLRGIASARHLPFVLAGLALGAAQLLYEGARFLVPILAVFFVHQAVTVRGFLRAHGARFAHMAVVSALVFAPIGFWYWDHPDELVMRSRAVTVFLNPAYLASRYPGLDTVHVVLAQWRKSLLGFALTGDGSAAFYGLRAPMVDPVTGALVLFSVLGLTLRPRPRHLSLVALWLWVPVAIACTFTIDPPPMTRLCLTIPAWAGIAALGVDRLARTFRPTSRVGHLAVATLLIGGLGYASLWNLRLFFDRYPRTLPANGWTVIGRLVRDKGPNFKSYMVSPMYLYAGAPEMRFWARQLAMDDLAVEAIPVRERGYRRGLFLVAPQLAPALTKLRAAYPTGQLREHHDELGRLLFISYEVDAAALNAAAGPDAPWRQADARFGMAGTGRGQFRDARALTVSAAGQVYVADAGNERIVKFEHDGTPLGEMPSSRSEIDRVQDFAAVAVDPNGRVCTLDREGRVVTRYSAAGTIESRVTLAEGSDPVAMVIAPDGDLLLADQARRMVVRLDTAGRVVAHIGAAAGLKSPAAVATGADGKVYVLDAVQQRVHRLSARLEPESDWSLRAAAAPCGASIAVSATDDAVYVIHRDTGTVGRYTRDGHFTWAIGDIGGPARLLGPTAVATDAAGSVYVLDGVRNQVVRFDVTHPLAAP